MGVRELDLVQDYTGHAYDMVLGIYYAKARMYDADDRRFMAVDPIKGRVANPQSINPYVYVLNNPIKSLDPLGLFTETTRISIFSNNGTAADMLDLQTRLMALGFLAPKDLSVRGMNPKIHEAIVDFKANAGLEDKFKIVVGQPWYLQKPSNYGVVDIKTWRALGLYTSNEISSVMGTSEEIIGNQVARRKLDSMIMQYGYGKITILNEYYNRIQCCEDNVKAANFLGKAFDIGAATAYNYQEWRALMPYPYTGVPALGAAFLQALIEEALPQYPSIVDTDAFVRKLAQNALTKAQKEYDIVKDSHLAYVIKDSERELASHTSYVRELTSLTSFTLQGVPSYLDTNKVTIAVKEYFLETSRLNISRQYKKDYVKALGLSN